MIIHYLLFLGDGNPHSCSYCKKTFLCDSALTIHERIHTGEKPFSCDMCNKCFSDPAVLNRHKKRVHSEEKPYPCNYCNWRFKERTDLKRHVQRKHSGGTVHSYYSLVLVKFC